MNLDKETQIIVATNKDEHVDIDGHGAKKVVQLDPTTGLVFDPRRMYGYDADTETWRPIELVESTESPGHYVLAVGNIDGSPITGGGSVTPTTDDFLLENGDFLLLENGDNLLLEA